MYFYPLLHCVPPHYFFFFFNDTATTEIYTLSLHDALPISWRAKAFIPRRPGFPSRQVGTWLAWWIGSATASLESEDRKSTRLNSSHGYISSAVFCLEKKKNITTHYSHNQTIATERHSTSQT